MYPSKFYPFRRCLCLLTLCLTLGLSSQAQIYHGTLLLTRQGLVDSVPILLGPVEIIDGNLLIGVGGNGQYTSNITDLTPLQSLKRIYGAIAIQNNDDLTSLHGLENLDTLDGFGYDSHIFNNDRLKNLEGLNGLSFMGDGLFYIEGNDSLQNLGGLDNLTTCRSITGIERNRLLSSTQGLNNLQEIDELSISFNPSLTEVSLPNLKKADDLYMIYDSALVQISPVNDSLHVLNLAISSNSLLTDIGGLQTVHVNRGLSVAYNTSLSNLSPLENCCDSILRFSINDNPNLADTITFLSLRRAKYFEFYNNQGVRELFFPNLETIFHYLSNDTFYIADCDSLRHFWMPKLTVIEGTNMNLYFNDQLENLDGLPSLEYVYRDLQINQAPSLNSITGLSNLKTVSNEFVIAGTALTDLHGLENMIWIYKLNLYSNPNLTSLCDFQLGGLGALYIAYCGRLKNLDQLDTLQYLWETLSIYNDDSLTSLKGLENIQTFGEETASFYGISLGNNAALDSLVLLQNATLTGGKMHVQLYQNDALRKVVLPHVSTTEFVNIEKNPRLTQVDFPDLEQVKEADYYYLGKIILRDNDSLPNLDGFRHLVFVTDSFSIRNNPLLSDCSALCDILEHIPTNKIKLSGNSFPCNTVADVNAYLCDTISAVSTTQGQGISQLIAYPSPAYQWLQLTGFGSPSTLDANLTVLLYDMAGHLIQQKRLTSLDERMDISALPNGIYQVHIPALHLETRFVVLYR